MREVLRVGIYELMELDLADHAIGGHVDVAKALGQPHLGNFVNGEPCLGISRAVDRRCRLILHQFVLHVVW